jgi:hypothetical protein
MYKIPVAFHMRIEAGFCRNPVRCMCRKLWPSLEEKFMKIYVLYVTKFLNERSNFGFNRKN